MTATGWFTGGKLPHQVGYHVTFLIFSSHRTTAKFTNTNERTIPGGPKWGLTVQFNFGPYRHMARVSEYIGIIVSKMIFMHAGDEMNSR